MRSSSTGSEEKSLTTDDPAFAFTSYEQMAEEAERYILELEGWMESFGPGSKKPWPAHNISNKQRRLAWVTKAREIFKRGAAREEGQAA